jgi:hypothetical protein
MAPADDGRNEMSDDGREAIDQAFAELVAGYHLTADRSDVPVSELNAEQLAPAGERSEATELAPAAERSEAIELAPAAEPEERFIPPPVEPLPRLRASTLLGWIGIGYAVVFVLLTAVGIRLPPLAGWLAIGGFVTSFAILASQLPRSRPPGDGAVL